MLCLGNPHYLGWSFLATVSGFSRFCFFAICGMFCEFDFKEFLIAGEHTAGNKQIQSIIATSPASTDIAVAGF